MSLQIRVDILPRGELRYETAGDYWKEDNALIFQIGDSGNDVYNRLVLIHEMIEQLLTEQAGISNEAIDAFDMAYTGKGEPGDQTDAPYRDQHCIATGVERMLCGILGIAWEPYDKAMTGGQLQE